MSPWKCDDAIENLTLRAEGGISLAILVVTSVIGADFYFKSLANDFKKWFERV